MNPLKIGQLKNMDNTLTIQVDSIISHVPPYVFMEVLDTELYDDITSNVNWIKYGMIYYDYLFCRKQIMIWTSMTGWGNLSILEKKIAANNFAVDSTKRLEVYGESELIRYWRDFVVKSQSVRTNRWSEAKSYISYELSTQNSIDLAKKTDSLSQEYIVYGIESFETDGSYGLFDWLGSQGIYSGGTGFNGQTYYTNNYETKLLEIIRDGLYVQ